MLRKHQLNNINHVLLWKFKNNQYKHNINRIKHSLSQIEKEIELFSSRDSNHVSSAIQADFLPIRREGKLLHN